MNLRRQYQVVETHLVHAPIPHPATIYDNREEAIACLWEMRKEYEHVGRHFTIRERQISSWKLIPLQQLPLGPPMTKR